MAAKTVNLQISESNHKPVLINEVMHELNPQAGYTYLDATAGNGGHARKIASVVGYKNITLVDADPEVIVNLRTEFNQSKLYNKNFASVVQIFKEQNVKFNLILADLGLSSLQLQSSRRGFSIKYDGLLDMRFNNKAGLSLLQLLSQVNERQLCHILKEYGQEPQASKIAKIIKLEQPQTTQQLAELVTKIKKKRKKIHPATQTFMALRIWVNDELTSLSTFLEVAPLLLKPQGKLAIISFHSLEDRLIKSYFKDMTDGLYDSLYTLQTKKPIIPNIETIKDHPESRSAKLRVLKRL